MQNSNSMFFIFYGVSLLFLALYAIGWQLVLKEMNLSVAYPLKVLTLVFGMFFGVVLFKENLTIGMIIGSLLIFLGVYFVGGSHE